MTRRKALPLSLGKENPTLEGNNDSNGRQLDEAKGWIHWPWGNGKVDGH